MNALPAFGQIQRIVSPDTLSGDYFGASVAFDGGRILVGASGESTCGSDSGAAYLYEEGVDGRFVQAARIEPENCKSGRFFGHAVALSGDHALVAGARNFLGGGVPNPVYVFERSSDGTWEESARLYPDDEIGALGFGASISLDDSVAVVTAVGDPEGGASGTVFVYELDSSQQQWRLTDKIQRGGRFGDLVVIDGDQLAVSAPAFGTAANGGVFVYQRQADGTWAETGRLGGFSDTRLRMDLDEDILVVGRAESERKQRGRADVFHRSEEGRWEMVDTLHPISSYDYGAFGTDVSISANRLLISGFTEQINLPFNIDRVVYVFRRGPSGAWTQQHIIDVGNTGFGAALDLDGQTALIGEAGDGVAGAAYVVRIF